MSTSFLGRAIAVMCVLTMTAGVAAVVSAAAGREVQVASDGSDDVQGPVARVPGTTSGDRREQSPTAREEGAGEATEELDESASRRSTGRGSAGESSVETSTESGHRPTPSEDDADEVDATERDDCMGDPDIPPHLREQPEEDRDCTPGGTPGPLAEGVDGFELSVTTSARHHRAGERVDLTVNACNQRRTELHQTFPQQDWVFVEAVAPSLEGHHNHPFTNDGLFFYDPQNRVHGPAGDDPAFSTSGRYATVAMTWWYGPHRSADEVVTWAPGECKVIPVDDWLQHDQEYVVEPERCPDMDEWDKWLSCLWREPVVTPQSRARPGDYVLRVHWGGVEAGKDRTRVVVDSAPFSLEGATLRVEVGGGTAMHRNGDSGRSRQFQAGEPVDIAVVACNETDVPFTEVEDDSNSTDARRFELELVGSVHNVQAGHEHPVLSAPMGDQPLTFAPGECHRWDLTWDQRFDDEPAAEGERVELRLRWNPGIGRQPFTQEIRTGIWVGCTGRAVDAPGRRCEA